MKNKKIILLSIFFLNTFLFFSQTGIVTYKTTQVSKRKTSRPEMARKIKEEVNRTSYILYFNEKKSFFKKEKKIPLYPFEAKVAAIFTGSNNNWHQFNNSKIAAHNSNILSKEYIVETTSRMKNWELINEVLIIDGYTCYKAINKEYNSRSGNYLINTAWYTLDIPVSYGPAGNGGLPGLILKLELRDNLYYLVDKIILNPKKMKKIPELKKGKKITVKEMVKLSRDARKVTQD